MLFLRNIRDDTHYTKAVLTTFRNRVQCLLQVFCRQNRVISYAIFVLLRVVSLRRLPDILPGRECFCQMKSILPALRSFHKTLSVWVSEIVLYVTSLLTDLPIIFRSFFKRSLSMLHVPEKECFERMRLRSKNGL